jgi:hypothetical protein
MTIARVMLMIGARARLLDAPRDDRASENAADHPCH